VQRGPIWPAVLDASVRELEQERQQVHIVGGPERLREGARRSRNSARLASIAIVGLMLFGETVAQAVVAGNDPTPLREAVVSIALVVGGLLVCYPVGQPEGGWSFGRGSAELVLRET
jgi:hypothetical protein